MRSNRPAAQHSASDRDSGSPLQDAHSLTSMGQAVVEKIIQPGQSGRVKFKASWWSARCPEAVTIPVGELVEVVGTEGITLLVEPSVLLKASVSGIAKIRQAWQQKGWQLQQPESSRVGAAIIVLTEDETTPGGIAAETWQRLLERKPIYVKTFKACCEVLGLKWQEVVAEAAEAQPASDASPGSPGQAQFAGAFNFVGRQPAIADLTQLQQAGAKVITILGTGGLGKTTLAREYLNQANFDLVLECWMAKTTQNLTPAENVVQEWLRRLGEQPGRNFDIALERLRRCLQQGVRQDQSVRIGVLIDNLESALDRQGQLIAAHRQYAALLEVLADPRVQSVTLVTSREPLHEVYVTAQSYRLASLDVAAWRDFFVHYQIRVNAAVLEQMHRAYAGNAKAMTILSSVIRVDCDGCMEAYWRDQTDLLADPSLESLVESHFSRLRQLYPEAYRLLYRLGCYRYQEVSNVPLAGLLTLLWDVPESDHLRVVRFLRDLFLVETSDLGYRLHPTIQVKAVEILQQQQEWQMAHQRAAAFWTAQVEQIITVEAALTALEAYHHQVQIQDWQAAAQVILQPRSAEGIAAEPLGVSFYRLGLLQPMIAAITQIIRRIQPGSVLGHLHRILGDLYWLTGQLHQALTCHDHACAIAMAYQIPALELVSLFNIGLCKIDLGELEEAFQIFSTVNVRATRSADLHPFAVGAWFCLALLHAYRGERETASRLMQQVSQQFTEISFSAWSRCYSLLFLGQTASYLEEFDSARRFYDLAQLFAERSQYLQVKAKALTGLAILCRQQTDCQGALTHLMAAKALLDQLEARSDLAEVHYQLGLTYDKLNDLAASHSHLQTAIELFQQIQAPRQVERVQQTLRTIASKSPE